MSAGQVTLSSGVELELDGDVNKLIEAIYDEIIVKSSFKAGFNDIASEVSFVISQMEEETRERYLFVALGVLLDRFHEEMYRELGERGG